MTYESETCHTEIMELSDRYGLDPFLKWENLVVAHPWGVIRILESFE